MDIKIGDYIEGYEQWGIEGDPELGIEPALNEHKMRIIVKDIWTDNDGSIHYYGIADDSWGGARGGSVCTKYGNVKVLTNEIPFTTRWWTKKYRKFELKRTAYKRDWKVNDLVRHFNGDLYKIIDIGVDTETEEEVIIYKKADDTGNIWVRPRYLFESRVDKDKYPDATQEWRFEIVE